jgi:hypothetical protein
MSTLLRCVKDSDLTLESPREDWVEALSAWLSDAAAATDK